MPIDPKLLAWLPRLRSVTTMNTPHYGTPLASFFATANGQRVLSALSALTVTGLSLGAQPLAAASVVLGVVACERSSASRSSCRCSIARSSRWSGSSTTRAARRSRRSSARSRTIRARCCSSAPSRWISSSPASPIAPASRINRPISMSPTPKPRRWLEQIGHPWRAVSLSLFFALHRITGAGQRALSVRRDARHGPVRGRRDRGDARARVRHRAARRERRHRAATLAAVGQRRVGRLRRSPRRARPLRRGSAATARRARASPSRLADQRLGLRRREFSRADGRDRDRDAQTSSDSRPDPNS